ncbi:MAG: hypothetical protein WAK17_18790 [Candidatus Nitrosopolaris sp.]
MPGYESEQRNKLANMREEETKRFTDSILRDDKCNKIVKKVDPPSYRRRKGPVATSTVKLMSYITVKGIESDTSYLQFQWPTFTLKELMDNAWDFLNDYYPNNPREDRKIAVTIKVDLKPDGEKDILRITVRNSNVDKIRVFEDLDSVFDYDQWYSTKRYQHRETCGSLGDFLKRGLGMGYASWTEGVNDDNSFTDEQWEEPLIVKHNGQENRVYITVNKGSNEPIKVEFEQGSSYTDTYTEVEVALPIDRMIEDRVREIEQYFKIYKIGKSRTEFSFNLIMPSSISGLQKDDSLVVDGIESEDEIGYAKV